MRGPCPQSTQLECLYNYCFLLWGRYGTVPSCNQLSQQSFWFLSIPHAAVWKISRHLLSLYLQLHSHMNWVKVADECKLVSLDAFLHITVDSTDTYLTLASSSSCSLLVSCTYSHSMQVTNSGFEKEECGQTKQGSREIRRVLFLWWLLSCSPGLQRFSYYSSQLR